MRIPALAAFLLCVQAAYVAWILGHPGAAPARCDLFAVFGGVEERVQRAVGLAARMDAKAFVVSDASAGTVQRYLRDYGRPGRAEILLEPDARHTVQNAWNVAALARARGFKTVVLATSWYHQPRALLFLRLALAGTDIRVLPLPTERVPERWWAEPYFWLEFPKGWGSLGQWALGSVLPASWGGRS